MMMWKEAHISGEEGGAVIEQVFHSFPFKPINPSQTRRASLFCTQLKIIKSPLIEDGKNWIAKISLTGLGLY